MPLIQFTENYDDLSTDLGYQFKFLCDRCGNGYMSTFQPSVVGTAGSVLRAAGSLFGGMLSNAGHGSYEIQRAIGGKGHDDAFRKAVEEVKGKFHQCKRCGKWICPDVCWNAKKGLCLDCAPDIQAELAAAQTAETINQMQTKLQSVDMTRDLDLTGDAVAVCPKCGARGSGKFCPGCGAALAPKVKCTKCGASLDANSRFCAECGQPVNKAKPKCSKCGKEFEVAPKFCDDCGTKL